MSFYEVRSHKKSAVQNNDDPVDTVEEEKKKTNLQDRLADMESSLAELTSELQYSLSTTLAVQGELQSFHVRANIVEKDAKTVSGSTRQQLLEHEKKYAEHKKIILLQKETLHAQQQTIKLLEIRLATLEETLGSTTADGRKTNERLLLLEKRTEEGFKTASEHVEAGLEDLANQCHAMLGKSARQCIKAMSAERQRSDGIAERLSSFSVSGQRTLEQQIFETVETIGSLKSALEEQIRTMWEHMLRGDGERAHMSRQSTKLTQRVEDADRELNTVASQVNQAAKQAWEAARLANDGKDDVRAMERKLAKMTGTVAQSRESTLSALSHMRETCLGRFATKGGA